MDLTNSEGIVFKKPNSAPSKLGSGRRRKQPTNASGSQGSVDLDVDILRTFEGPSETIPRRLDLYEYNVDRLQLCLQRVHDKFNSDLNDKLLNFVLSSFNLIDKIDSVVPIGILESGLSFGENCVIFDYIENKLKSLSKDQEKVIVIRIQSGTSSTTKAVFQKLCRQIIDLEVQYDDDMVSEESSPEKKETTVRTLGKYYSLYDVKTFLSSMEQKYKLVIIIEDVDFFANSVITQTLTLMGCARLPITFIFGATHGQFIENLIPLHCSSEFVLEKFYSVSPKDRLNEFMRLVLMDPTMSFRVSGPIISYLDSYYKEDNYSVEHIFNSIKFCLRYHFLTGKSTFCSLESVDAYSERHVALFTNVVQEVSLTEETPRKRIKATSVSDPPEKLLNDTVDALKAWNFILRLLCFINLRLPCYPLGDSYALMYVSCYSGYTSAKESDDGEPFHRLFKDLNSLSKVDFQTVIEDCVGFLQKPKNLPNLEWASEILIEFKRTLSSLMSEQKTNADSKQEAKKTIKLRQQKSIKDLQQSLMETKRQIEGTSLAYKTKKHFIGVFRKLLKIYFMPFSTLKNSDIFVFTDLNQLVNALYPANFLQLNEDITRPEYVLQCECCSKLDDTSVDASLPDVCIIHKLLLEHTTKKVDLNLIYHAFLVVVQPQPQTIRRKSAVGSSKDAALTASCLIRFRRAVGELQHMGFLKRSKSKPDEVSRLTWW